MKGSILSALLVLASPALAEDYDFPAECNGTYITGMLIKIEQACKTLRLTDKGQKAKLVFMQSPRAQSQYCRDLTLGRMARELVHVQGNAVATKEDPTELWCASAFVFMQWSVEDGLVEERGQ